MRLVKADNLIEEVINKILPPEQADFIGHYQ